VVRMSRIGIVAYAYNANPNSAKLHSGLLMTPVGQRDYDYGDREKPHPMLCMPNAEPYLS
jgi:hypothetical protein